MSTPPILDAENMKHYIKDCARRVDHWLAQSLTGQGLPDGLRKGMEYSLCAGGKRMRPVLCMASAALCGMSAHNVADIVPFAGALEMVHTYSLIHDDLPAMDNDDLRRGIPTNHKVFGEANAILAGDALLTDAFAVMAALPLPPQRVLSAIARFAKAAGSPGMVGGQYLDMLHQGHCNTDMPTLQNIHALKTGAIITAACVCGALLAGAKAEALDALEQYGANFGVAFQIYDDILDATGTAQELGKTPGKDAACGKATYPSLIGLEASRTLAHDFATRAVDSLAAFAGHDAAFLRALALYAVARTH